MPKRKQLEKTFDNLLGPEPAPKAAKAKRSRNTRPSLKNKLRNELKLQRKSLIAERKVINKKLTQVKRDLQSLSGRKRKRQTLTRVRAFSEGNVPFVEGGGFRL